MWEKVAIYGFDWPNRSWKWTQLKLMQQIFESHWIPAIIIRWDGTRPATWNNIGDTFSSWREKMNPKLKWEESTPELWEEAAHRLAREMLIYKQRTLPGLIKQYKSQLWILLVDRSLISRSLIPSQYHLKHLYYWNYIHWQKINIDDVKPNLLFCLNVTKEELSNRLSKQDPKYLFRKQLIEENSRRYIHNIQYLPQHIQKNVKIIEGERDIASIHNEIKQYIYHNLKQDFSIDLSYLR